MAITPIAGTDFKLSISCCSSTKGARASKLLPRVDSFFLGSFFTTIVETGGIWSLGISTLLVDSDFFFFNLGSIRCRTSKGITSPGLYWEIPFFPVLSVLNDRSFFSASLSASSLAVASSSFMTEGSTGAGVDSLFSSLTMLSLLADESESNESISSPLTPQILPSEVFMAIEEGRIFMIVPSTDLLELLKNKRMKSPSLNKLLISSIIISIELLVPIY